MRKRKEFQERVKEWDIIALFPNVGIFRGKVRIPKTSAHLLETWSWMSHARRRHKRPRALSRGLQGTPTQNHLFWESFKLHQLRETQHHWAVLCPKHLRLLCDFKHTNTQNGESFEVFSKSWMNPYRRFYQRDFFRK